jgi:catechol 2,3-dioxygenase-like lactoylglutathione lyase family enzyme
MDASIRLAQINLVVRDMAASLAFYRLLGLDVGLDRDEDVEPVHVELDCGGISLELDAADSVRHWDAGWSGGTGGAAVLGFALASREAVDTRYGELVAAGHVGHQPPYDAFFGARYAIVEDPDGNPIALMSPLDPDRRTWPPADPPRPTRAVPRPAHREP